MEEEIGELKAAVSDWQGSVPENADARKKAMEAEFGDVVFSLINYARFLQLDAEHALETTNKKFMSRFLKMEEKAMQNGMDLQNMTLQEMDALWNSIKQQQQE